MLSKYMKRRTRRYQRAGTTRRRKGKKWVTAIEAAQGTFKHTGSIKAANRILRKQALTNAKKLFGSI